MSCSAMKNIDGCTGAGAGAGGTGTEVTILRNQDG